MTQTNNLQRFITAQQPVFNEALDQVAKGRKTTHWMWFVFPQLKELGRSETARYYGILDLKEATGYLQHNMLGMRLVAICKLLLDLNDKTAHDIFGSPDDLKLHSCMTLFSLVPGTDPVFKQVLDKYYDGLSDEKTIGLIEKVADGK